MEDITKRIIVQTPILFIGAVLLFVGAIGYWPFSDPPLQIQEPFINWGLIIVGSLLIIFGTMLSVAESLHHRKTELNEHQLARFQQELKLKSETLISHQELLKKQEEYLEQQHEEISKQLEKKTSEVLNKNESLAQLQKQYTLILLQQEVILQVAENEGERIFGEYSNSYWSMYQMLGQEGLIDINLSLEEVQESADGSLQKLLLSQFPKAFALKGLLLSRSKLFKDSD
jgi:hypothetical protein